MNINLFQWIREGVRHSVLLGVSDAVEQIGTHPTGDNLSTRLGEYLRSSTSHVPSRVGGSTQRKRLGRTLKDHLMLRHPRGEAARRYNLLQQLAYLGLMFVILPLMILTGLSMSPRLNATFPGWVDLLGGRQSARSLHFLAAAGLLLFTLVHVFEVILAGVWNEIRSMVTGWYTVRANKTPKGS